MGLLVTCQEVGLIVAHTYNVELPIHMARWSLIAKQCRRTAEAASQRQGDLGFLS